MSLAVIMPVAGKGTRFHELGEQYPKCCLPYQGIPIIVHNLRLVFERDPEAIVFVVTGHRGDFVRQVVTQFMANFIEQIRFVDYDNSSGIDGPLVSINSAVSSPNFYGFDSVLVLLGDAVFERLPVLTNSWLGFQFVEDFSRWCMVKLVDGRITLFDKPSERPSNNALSGAYFYSNAQAFIQSVRAGIEQSTVLAEAQISYAINEYLKLVDDVTICYVSPIDLGTMGDYLKNRGVSPSRSFNKITVWDDRVAKSSTDPQKMFNEVSWFNFVPPNLWKFIPDIYETTWNNPDGELGIDCRVGYVMENIEGISLRDYFLFVSRDADEWETIISKLFAISDQMKRMEFPSSSFFQRLKTKTAERAAIVSKMYPREQFVISRFLENFNEHMNELSESPDHFFHGDLCLSNVIYNPQTKHLTLIDPRGDIFGNSLYDYAKLCHSFLFPYDYIDSGLYYIDPITERPFFFNFGESTDKIKQVFRARLNERLAPHHATALKYIVASLFLTMIPLHSHDSTNQALYYRVFSDIFAELDRGDIRL